MAPPPPPVPLSAGAQYVQQFLSTALSQRGPAALPYAEDVKWLIRNHLVALAEEFPSLQVRSALFTHNDGRAATLLQAEGTIPVVFAGAVYNLPGVIWLPEPYPRSPPLVFLTPTRDMLIKPLHPHVDRSGLVLVPYLRSWIFPSSNLLDLVRSLSHLFGHDPPLYSRQPAATNPSPNPNPIPSNSTPNPSPTPPSSTRIYSSSTTSSPYSGRFPPSPQVAPRPPAEDPAEVFRHNAIGRIVDTTRADLVALRQGQTAEMEALFAVQAELRRRQTELAHGLRQMTEVKEALEQQLQLVLMNTDVMEGWARENASTLGKEVDVDVVFQPADVLSRQMLECTAADLGAEDALYALDKALQEDVIPFEGYMRNVRALAREQFFQRVLSARVRAAQVQAQVASMAARAQQYAS